MKRCEDFKELIADYVGGNLSQSKKDNMQRHIDHCAVCRDYAEALQREDSLLSGLFAGFDGAMVEQEDEIIRALSFITEPKFGGVIYTLRAALERPLVKFACAAVVVSCFAVFFVMSLKSIREIHQCIQLCS